MSAARFKRNMSNKYFPSRLPNNGVEDSLDATLVHAESGTTDDIFEFDESPIDISDDRF